MGSTILGFASLASAGGFGRVACTVDSGSCLTGVAVPVLAARAAVDSFPGAGGRTGDAELFAGVAALAFATTDAGQRCPWYWI